MRFHLRLVYSFHYKKPTLWVTSPTVQRIVREHFNCSTLKGMALEDYPVSGGYGDHWEARLTGPEVRASPSDTVICSYLSHSNLLLSATLMMYVHTRFGRFSHNDLLSFIKSRSIVFVSLRSDADGD